MRDPRRYGVIEFDAGTGKAISIEEKPENPKSNFAVPGIYIYDNSVIDIAKNLKPSHRVSSTDVNRAYLAREELYVHKLSRGFAWLDAGTSSSFKRRPPTSPQLKIDRALRLAAPRKPHSGTVFYRSTSLKSSSRILQIANTATTLEMVGKEWHRTNKS